MTISDIAIRRPVFTTMVTLGIVVLGWMGLSRLGTSLFPDVTFPLVTVVVPYPGAGPEDVERQVVKPIEDAVVALNKIDRVESIARENVGIVVVAFDLDADLEASASDVRERVAAIERTLPEGAEKPVVQKADIGAAPVLVYSASAALPAEEVRRLTEDVIRPALEQVDGVARVDVIGGKEREIQVELDPVRLEAFKLTPLAVSQKLRYENATVPAGHWSAGGRETSVRTLGELRSVEDVRSAVVFAGPDGRSVRVGDLGEVKDGFKEQRTLVRTNGNEAVAFQVVKNSGANTVAVADAVKAEIERIRGSLPQGFETSLLIDQSGYIKENAHEVNLAIVFGGAMAILVILFFMMDLRSTFISALALPTAVIGTFLMMWALDFTLNMMTLLALSLAIGLLIDDAVVVRENIFRHLENGEEPAVAASKGTSEIALAVFATTMTIVAVFVPVAFMSGIVGQFFRQFGLTVTAAVLLSMVVAFTLDPMLSARLAKRVVKGEHVKKGRIAERLSRFFDANDRWYSRALAWTLDHPRSVVASATAVFVTSLVMAGSLGADFMAPEDRGQVIVNVEFPAETSLEETARRSAEIEKKLLDDGRFKTVFATLGPEGDVNEAKYRLDAGPKTERKEGILELKRVVRDIVSASGAKVVLEDVPIVEGLGGTWRPMMVSLSGPDYDVLVPAAEKIAAALRETPGAADVSVEHAPGKPEMRVDLDRGVAGAVGLPIARAGLEVRAAIDGNLAGTMRAVDDAGREDEIDIRVRLAAADRSSPDALARLPLPAAMGTVRLGDVARIEPGTAPAAIQRIDRERRILVTAAASGRPLGSVFMEARPKVDALVPDGYRLTWLGDVENMEESNASFGLALGVAVLFIYIVLASQFESFAHPLTIMLSLPLALVGAMMGLWLYGSAITLGAQIGIILLMGLVTKNAILLVDKALVFQREGMSPREAILAAGPMRLRPILMTSAAMVLGMLPTALGRGEGSEFRAPMAIAVVGGVISSTFLTLLVVPVVYLFVERVRTGAAGFVKKLASGGRAPKLAAGSLSARSRSPGDLPGPLAGALFVAALLGAALWILLPSRAHAAEPPAETSMTLEQAWELADRSSPDLAAAAEKVEQAQADARAAWAGVLPHVDAQGSYLWYNREIPLVIQLPALPPVDTGVMLQESPTYQGQLVGRLPLFNPTAWPTLAAARHGEKATAAAVEDGRQELFLAVARAWWGVAVADRLIAASDEGVANAAELARVSQAQVDAQVATELALVRARTAEQQARQAALAARGARAGAEAALKRLTGAQGRIVPAGAEAKDLPKAPAAEEAWAAAKTKRPDLRSAHEAEKASRLMKRSKQASYLPTIAGQGTWWYTSNEGLTGYNEGGSLGVVATWSLFDGGLREAQLSRAASEARESSARKDATYRAAEAEIATAVADYETALAARDAAAEAARLAARAQELATAQYKAGTATNLEVTTANATLLQARAGAAQAEAQAALAALALKKASGEKLR